MTIKKLLEQYSYETKKGMQNVWDEFLDFCIGALDYSNFVNGYDDYLSSISKYVNGSPTLARALVLLMQQVADNIDNGVADDELGKLYEQMFQSRGKAQAMGQFFTPMELCDLMARGLNTDIDNHPKNINDCACGSGRTLLSVHNYIVKKCGNDIAFYQGDDLDMQSVKMCAINLCLYGCRGEVRHIDTLRLYGEWTKYVLNEVRYPIPTPFYSIRKTTFKVEKPQEIVASRVDKKLKNKSEQLEMF